VRPARQGAFDGLCGVYAIMNALDLVGVDGPKRALHRNLFHQLTRGLGPAALVRGMKTGLTAGELRRASRPAFRWLAEEHGVHLNLTQPFVSIQFFDLQDFIGSLAMRSRKLEAAAIVQIQTHGSAHWTVAKSIGHATIALRDSTSRKEIEVDQFGLDRGARFFRPANTLLLSRRQGEVPVGSKGSPPSF
jgi:hypothetical protein